MNGIKYTTLLLCLALCVACAAEPEPPEPAPRPVAPPHPVDGVRDDIASRTFHIDRKWKSMEGPFQIQSFKLAQATEPEILWLTGYRAEIVGADGESEVSQEFMCHNNLDLDLEKPSQHMGIFGWDRAKTTGANLRLFTLSQGQFDVALPAGFGVPVRSDEELFLSTQVLNHNMDDPDVEVRHRISMDVTRDAELDEPLRPLYQSSVFVMASLEDSEVYFGVMDPGAAQQGAACSVGSIPGTVEEAANIYRDPFGRRFTGHWVVKPGREERHTLVTRQLNLTFDTRVHFIGAHLHPFAETLSLRDLTTGETLYTVRATNPADGIGLDDLTFYSSAEGIPMYRDHEYELVSVYENTSGVDQDAMATLFLYLFDADAAKALEFMRRI